MPDKEFLLLNMEQRLSSYEHEIKKQKDSIRELIFWEKFPEFDYLLFKSKSYGTRLKYFNELSLVKYSLVRGFTEDSVLQRIDNLGFTIIDEIAQATPFFKLYLPLDSKLEYLRPEKLNTKVEPTLIKTYLDL